MTFIRNRWYVAAWDGEVASKPLIAENPDMALRVLSIDSGGAHARKVISKLMELENG